MAPPIQLVDLVTNAATRITMRYREPYVTEAINKKLAVTLPLGIYRGWRLTAAGAAMKVTITADADFNDHVLSTRGELGDSLTIRLDGGNILLDLLPFAIKTVVIGVFSYYSIASDTTAEIRGYLEADWNNLSALAQSEVVVLGTVVVPAGGIITAASITHDHRSEAWANVAPAATAWAPLVKNGGFEWGYPGQLGRNIWPPWDNTTVTNGSWTVQDTDPDPESGTQHLVLSRAVPAGALTGYLTQRIDAPLNKAKHIRLRFRLKALQVATAGTLTVSIGIRDTAGASSPLTLPVALTGVDLAYRTVDKIFLLPVGFATSQVGDVTILATGLTFAAPFGAVQIDNLQVFLETQDALSAHPEYSGKGTVVTKTVVFTDPTQGADKNSIRATIDPSLGSPGGTGELAFERMDGDLAASQPSVLVRGPLTGGGGGTLNETGIHGIGSPPNGVGVWGEGKGVGKGGLFAAATVSLGTPAGEGSRSTGGNNTAGGFLSFGGVGAAGYGGTGVTVGGVGVFGQAGGPNGFGMQGVGLGTGVGIYAQGGATSPVGFTSRSDGAGGRFDGGGAGSSGVTGQGSVGAGTVGVSTLSFLDSGVIGVGSGIGSGVVGVSSQTAGAAGISGHGSDGVSADGVHGTGSGNGSGVEGTGAWGVKGTAVGAGGIGGEFSSFVAAGVGVNIYTGLGATNGLAMIHDGPAPAAIIQNTGAGTGIYVSSAGIDPAINAFSSGVADCIIAEATTGDSVSAIGPFGFSAVKGSNVNFGGNGVYGTTTNVAGIGVLAESLGGGRGLSATANSSGVAAQITQSGNGYAVDAANSSATFATGRFINALGGSGVKGSSAGGIGIEGSSTSGNGVEGSSTTGNGVQGNGATGTSGVFGVQTNASGFGVAGRSTTVGAFGVFADNQAAGGVALKAVATGTTAAVAQFYSGSESLEIRGHNPALGTGFKNTVTNKNTCKAWGVIAFDSVNTPYLTEGFNVSSVTGSAGQYTVNFVIPIGRPQKQNLAVVGGLLTDSGTDVVLFAPNNAGLDVFEPGIDEGRFIFITGSTQTEANSSPYDGPPPPQNSGWSFLIKSVASAFSLTMSNFDYTNAFPIAFTGQWYIHYASYAVSLTLGHERNGVGAPSPTGVLPRSFQTRPGFFQIQLTDGAGAFVTSNLQSYTVSFQIMGPQYP